MRAPNCAFVLLVLPMAALAQTNAVPLPVSGAERPAAVIGQPTNVIPPGARPSVGNGSSAMTLTEETAGFTADHAARSARTIKATSRIISRTLGPLGAAVTGLDVGANLYRASECEERGDLAGADRALAEAAYDTASLVPGVGLAQACFDVIGNLTVGEDVVKDYVVRTMAEEFARSRDGRPFLSDGQGRVGVPQFDEAVARRRAAQAEMTSANAQAAAYRPAPEPGPWSDPQVTQMMWMLMPAMISASQQRALQRPATPSAPSAPTVRCLEGQSYEYDANGRATPCPGFRDFVRRNYGQ